jgi:transposase
MLTAIFYVLRTGIPWRDLPRQFGPWSSVYSRFRRWSAEGLFAQMLALIAARSIRCFDFLREKRLHTLSLRKIGSSISS